MKLLIFKPETFQNLSSCKGECRRSSMERPLVCVHLTWDNPFGTIQKFISSRILSTIKTRDFIYLYVKVVNTWSSQYRIYVIDNHLFSLFPIAEAYVSLKQSVQVELFKRTNDLEWYLMAKHDDSFANGLVVIWIVEFLQIQMKQFPFETGWAKIVNQ